MEMTRKEAEGIIQRIAAGFIDCDRSEHFLANLREEGFTVQDIAPILRSHVMVAAPEAMASGAARVRLSGKCLEGRPTLLVLDLWLNGPCTCVTIMVDKRGKEGRRAR